MKLQRSVNNVSAAVERLVAIVPYVRCVLLFLQPPIKYPMLFTSVRISTPSWFSNNAATGAESYTTLLYCIVLYRDF